MNSKITISDQIEQLSCLSTIALWEMWDACFKHRPQDPNRNYLESRIAYKLQENAFGGLPPATRHFLEKIGLRRSTIKKPGRASKVCFAPGTVFIREWESREHRVVVNAEGQFQYQGQLFRSITAVARHIAGTHWSGPAFFGLNQEKGSQHD